MNEINFKDAWQKLIFNKVTIKSKNSGFIYRYYDGKVQYFNPVIRGWQVCTFMNMEEILDKWIVEDVEQE